MNFRNQESKYLHAPLSRLIFYYTLGTLAAGCPSFNSRLDLPLQGPGLLFSAMISKFAFNLPRMALRTQNYHIQKLQLLAFKTLTNLTTDYVTKV